MLFTDRQDAGKLLAIKLQKLKIDNGVVLGLTRGGVIPAFEIAKKLSYPIDVCVVKKLSAPYLPELAIGAVTSSGRSYIDKNLIASLEVSKNYLKSEIERKRTEANKLENIFRRNKPEINLFGKNVILVDDGVATGASILAAISKIKKEKPKKIILAVPVGSPSVLEKLAALVDKIVVLIKEENFSAVGQFYKDFVQVEDKNVLEILNTTN